MTRASDILNMIKTIKNLIWDKIVTEGKMLDLGSGNGQDAVAATEAGLKVTAVDKNPVDKTSENSRVDFVVERIENFKIEKNKYNLIYADNSLPFLKKEDAVRVIKDAAFNLKKDGVLYFSLFGINDAWSEDKNMNFWTRDEVNDFISTLNLSLYRKVEEEGYAPKMNGEIKYWHIFRFILKK